jgi:hypothetical protein
LKIVKVSAKGENQLNMGEKQKGEEKNFHISQNGIFPRNFRPEFFLLLSSPRIALTVNFTEEKQRQCQVALGGWPVAARFPRISFHLLFFYYLALSPSLSHPLAHHHPPNQTTPSTSSFCSQLILSPSHRSSPF